MIEITRERHPEWIWPRADSHIVLSADGSPEAFKVFVEPGGSFSPGLASYGVSLWLYLPDTGELIAPERLPRDRIRDRLLGGILPVYRSRWRAGALEVDLRLAVEPCPDERQPAVALWARLTLRGEAPCVAHAYLVCRSLGPAGGPVRRIAWSPDLRGLLVNDRVALLSEQPVDQAGCCTLADEPGDLSLTLLRGRMPVRQAAEDSHGYAAGVLSYLVHLAPGEAWECGWTAPVLPGQPLPGPALRAALAVPARERIDTVADDWRERLVRCGIQCPDGRLAEAFNACLTHLTMAAVAGEPRVATVCYPLFWVRDGVYQIRALDAGGLHARARAGLAALEAQPWGGGFGAEADAPGQALWALDQHHRLTRDDDWLEQRAEFVLDRADWIHRMRSASEPIHVASSSILPRTRLHRDGDLLCEPARDGLIVGRMDWHRPLWWVNAWSLCGLRAAARMLTIVDRLEPAEACRAEADALAAALDTQLDLFGGNERDPACAVWPTGARAADDPDVADAFARWWREHRFDELGRYRPEPRWRYFELAQAHGLLLLGDRDAALLTLEHFFRSQDAPGLYAWAEGDETGDPSGDWRLIRGWWPTGKIVPHGWCAAEMALLLRDMFVFERDDTLVIGAGVRPEWMAAGDDLVGITAAPTWFGPVTWRLLHAGHARRWQLSLCCDPPPPGGYRLRLPLPPQAAVELDGAGIREEDGDWPVPPVGPDINLIIDLP